MRVFVPFQRNLHPAIGSEITTSCFHFRKAMDIVGVRSAAVNLQEEITERYWGDVMVLSWTKNGIKCIQCFKIVDIKVDDLDFMDGSPDELVDFDTQYGRLR